MTAVLLVCLLLMSWLGNAFLALGQARHRLSVTGRADAYPLPRARLIGTMLLMLAAILAVLVHASFAALTIPLVQSVGILATAFTLAWRRSWFQPLAAVLTARRLRQRCDGRAGCVQPPPQA